MGLCGPRSSVPGRMVEPRSHLEPALRRWLALLAVSALAVVAFGLWQVSPGNGGSGVAMIVIAVVDVAFVYYLVRRRRGQ